MEQLTSTQLGEWEACDKLDPIGTWRDDYRIAALSALIMNIVNVLFHEKGKAKPKLVNPLDYMPKWIGESDKKEVKEQSVEEMKVIFRNIEKYQNKEVKQKIFKRKK